MNDAQKWIEKAYNRSVSLRMEARGMSSKKLESELNTLQAMVKNIMNCQAYKNGSLNTYSQSINSILGNLEALQKILEKKEHGFSLKSILIGIIDILSSLFGLGSLGTKLLGSGN